MARRSVDGDGYGISLTLCLVIFVAGVLVFRKLEPRILKEV